MTAYVRSLSYCYNLRPESNTFFWGCGYFGGVERARINRATFDHLTKP